MLGRDLDGVKTRLRGLWTQYGAADGGAGAEAGDGAAAGAAAAAAAAVEEVVLFPSYAFRDERLKVWRVQVHGWAFSRNATTRRVRLAASLLRRFIRVAPGGVPDRVLMERISYLFAAQPQSCDMAKVAMAGIVEPAAAFALHTHPHPPALPHDHPPPQPATAVNLLDAPLVLASRFDPRSPPAQQQEQQQKQRQQHGDSGHLGHTHDRLVAGPLEGAGSGAGRTIMQKALQIDAFAWQNLALADGRFQGEILVGFNELEWLLQSFCRGSGPPCGRRLIELRGKLFGWTDEQTVTGLVHLVEAHGVSVVSDIDDTIKASNITAEKRIVLETVFTRPLQAVPGMAALYGEWQARGCEFHYVSNSPWQLYPALDGFFRENRFPAGSAHLRSFDPSDLLSIRNYTGTPQLKRDTIERLFAAFPARRFVLVGDCGEHDLETYTDLARRFPGRILRIFIRDLFAPMAVPSVTTDTDAAGNTVSKGGLVPIGIVAPRPRSPSSSSSSSDNDLMCFSPSDGDVTPPAPPQARVRPVPPPKPARLRAPVPLPSSSQTSPVPPPKPPRRAATANPMRASSTDAGSGTTVVAGPVRPQRPRPPPVPRRNGTGSSQMPGGWTAGGAAPGPPSDTASLPASETAMERLEAQARQLRGLAQQWMAFYAQQFYVAPTRSFLRYAQVFLPTVESDMRIIDYDSIHAESVFRAETIHRQQSQQDLTLGAPQQQPPPQQPGFPFDIPEPPPPEAQLVRSERRLRLWKSFVAATRDLPPSLCRLFVDAGDIEQDAELPALLDRYNSNSGGGAGSHRNT